MESQPLKTYSWWDQVPEHLKTKTQLGKEHLKPGGPVRARVEYTVWKRLRSYDLYDVKEAVEKVATPAQLAALEKARIVTRTCSMCGTVVDKPSDLSTRTGRCEACLAKAAEAKRARELDATIVWARRMLATPGALILDTETTDLHGRICEIGIIRMDGSTVFESLINPQEPIQATHIHGITDRMVRDAPTFADIEPQLRVILHGKTVVVYNADYDAGVLEGEINRLCTPPDEVLGWLIEQDYEQPRGHRSWGTWEHYYAYRRLISEHAHWWRGRVDWQDAMIPYSCYVGDWHPHYRNYSYQALGGGHRAVGDCLACLGVLRRMAATALSTEKTDGDPTEQRPD